MGEYMAKEDLFSQFGKEYIKSLTEAYDIDEDHIIFKYAKKVTSKRFADSQDLEAFLNWMKQFNYDGTGMESYYVNLIRKYMIAKQDEEAKSWNLFTLEESESEDDDELLEEIHEQIMEIKDEMSSLIDIMIGDEQISDVYKKTCYIQEMLKGLQSKQTPKKAEYEQVEDLKKKFDILLLNTRQYSQRVKAIEKPIQAPFTKRCEDIFCKNKNKLIFYGFIFYTLILLVLLIKVGW